MSCAYPHSIELILPSLSSEPTGLLEESNSQRCPSHANISFQQYAGPEEGFQEWSGQCAKPIIPRVIALHKVTANFTRGFSACYTYCGIALRF